MNVKVLTEASETRAMESRARHFRIREGLGGRGRARQRMAICPGGLGQPRPWAGGTTEVIWLCLGRNGREMEIHHPPGSVIQFSWATAVLVGIPTPCLLLWPPEGSRWQVSIQFVPQTKSWPGDLGSIPSSPHRLPELRGSRIWTAGSLCSWLLDLNWDLRPPKEEGWVELGMGDNP